MYIIYQMAIKVHIYNNKLLDKVDINVIIRERIESFDHWIKNKGGNLLCPQKNF